MNIEIFAKGLGSKSIEHALPKYKFCFSMAKILGSISSGLIMRIEVPPDKKDELLGLLKDNFGYSNKLFVVIDGVPDRASFMVTENKERDEVIDILKKSRVLNPRGVEIFIFEENGKTVIRGFVSPFWTMQKGWKKMVRETCRTSGMHQPKFN